MTCEACRARLSEHLDQPSLAIERHLRECPGCDAELARLRAALAWLAAPPAGPAPDLRAAVWAQVAANAPRRVSPWYAAAASAALAATVLWVCLGPLPAWLAGWEWRALGDPLALLTPRLADVRVSLDLGAWVREWMPLLSGWAETLPAYAVALVAVGLLGTAAAEVVTRGQRVWAPVGGRR